MRSRMESWCLIENACPIQEEFPGYAALPPQAFDLEALELEEIECQRAAARRLFGDAGREGYETTIAAAIHGGPSTSPTSTDP